MKIDLTEREKKTLFSLLYLLTMSVHLETDYYINRKIEFELTADQLQDVLSSKDKLIGIDWLRPSWYRFLSDFIEDLIENFTGEKSIFKKDIFPYSLQEYQVLQDLKDKLSDIDIPAAGESPLNFATLQPLTPEQTFEHAFNLIVKLEGYKSDDPDDYGKRTIFGISSAYHPELVEQLWNLPEMEALEKAKEFYFDEYWDIARLNIPKEYRDNPILQIILFCFSVNPGITYAKAWGESILNVHDTRGNIENLLWTCAQHYLKRSNARNNIKYLRGWINRLISIRDFLNFFMSQGMWT